MKFSSLSIRRFRAFRLFFAECLDVSNPRPEAAKRASPGVCLCLASSPNPSRRRRSRPLSGWLVLSEPPADCVLHPTLFHPVRLPSHRERGRRRRREGLGDDAKHILRAWLRSCCPSGTKTSHPSLGTGCGRRRDAQISTARKKVKH